jgi:hypothetical protein
MVLKLARGQLMQLDELESRCCRKEKISMAKSPKSRCCKSRCSKVKGLPEGDLFDIGVYTFFPTTQGRYLYPKDNPDS